MPYLIAAAIALLSLQLTHQPYGEIEYPKQRKEIRYTNKSSAEYFQTSGSSSGEVESVEDTSK